MQSNIYYLFQICIPFNSEMVGKASIPLGARGTSRKCKTGSKGATFLRAQVIMLLLSLNEDCDKHKEGALSKQIKWEKPPVHALDTFVICEKQKHRCDCFSFTRLQKAVPGLRKQKPTPQLILREV